MRTLLILLIGFLLAACSPAASASPAAVATAGPTETAPPTAAPSPTASPTSSPTPTPPPSPTPTATPTFAACALPTLQVKPPSGRLVDVKATPGATADTVVFTFKPGGDNPAPPTGALRPTKPPFSESASGKAIKVAGDRFLQVKLQNMTLQDASGPVYTGKHDIKGVGPGLRQVVNYDEFEGYSGWIVGMDSPTCVTVTTDPAALTVTLTIAHP